ncbi:putative protein translocase subunit SecA, SecA DEAD-like, SecA motor DEAD [Helianthus annuus]|nr:putative protein translocase subunit SecA, SecA DEAD-like, SecA motor DEAD [Helianthus annuus]
MEYLIWLINLIRVWSRLLVVQFNDRSIAEMKTRYGKTLVSTLAAYLNTLTGEGVHVVTVNDYFAQCDAEWMGCVHRFLGLSVGLIQVIKNPLCLIMSLTLSYVFLHSKIYCRGDLVQVDTWVAPNDKNGKRRDWLLCDYKTDEVLTRASRL